MNNQCIECTPPSLLLGFDSVLTVNAGEIVSIPVAPQVVFRGARLFVAPSCADVFDIVDIKVGKNSQMIAMSPIPAETFSQVDQNRHRVGQHFKMQSCQIGETIYLIACNVGVHSRRFKASLIGEAG